MSTSPSQIGTEISGPLGPTASGDRIDSVDTLRGVALLGIFVMNIPTFALPEAAFLHPPLAGGFSGVDYAAWLVSHLFFEFKMMAIFSMLFGAGVALMGERIGGSGRRPARTHYQRMGWLLLFGMLHAYLIWFGDILVAYAIIGMLVYPLRRLGARWLLVIGVVLLPVAMMFSGLMQLMFEYMRSEAASGNPDMVKAWADVGGMFNPTPEMLDEERQRLLGSFVSRAVDSAPNVLQIQVFMLTLWALWRVGGLMLIGMALYKWRVLSAERSVRFYAAMTGLGFGLGLPIVGTGVWMMHRNGFDPIASFGVVGMFNYVGSLGVAAGWVGLVLLICRLGLLTRVRSLLASVGRMALTNYLMQSLIAAFIFYGWGLGRFDTLARSELLLVVLGVWALQLVFSPLWLARFRYGPMEWVWRGLTYWRLPPLRRTSA
ncbi:MAG: DUF418 domain-containing protein [Phycisphaeraceae bacterium]|nr:DUF418 domain-containing protein [Phycisphaeraceae bacterium]